MGSRKPKSNWDPGQGPLILEEEEEEQEEEELRVHRRQTPPPPPRPPPRHQPRPSPQRPRRPKDRPPPTAFELYFQRNRPEALEKYPFLNNAEIDMKLHDDWRIMIDERYEYVAEANELKRRYEEARAAGGVVEEEEEEEDEDQKAYRRFYNKNVANVSLATNGTTQDVDQLLERKWICMTDEQRAKYYPKGNQQTRPRAPQVLSAPPTPVRSPKKRRSDNRSPRKPLDESIFAPVIKVLKRVPDEVLRAHGYPALPTNAHLHQVRHHPSVANAIKQIAPVDYPESQASRFQKYSLPNPNRGRTVKLKFSAPKHPITSAKSIIRPSNPPKWPPPPPPPTVRYIETAIPYTSPAAFRNKFASEYIGKVDLDPDFYEDWRDLSPTYIFPEDYPWKHVLEAMGLDVKAFSF